MIEPTDSPEDFDKLTARARRLGWALMTSCRGGFTLEQHPRQIFCGDSFTLTKTLIELGREKRRLTDKPFSN